MKAYMAIDQYGQTEHLGFTNHPRKTMLEKLGYKKASKMYVSKTDGRSVHIGYIIGQRWFRLFEVTPFERSAQGETF